MVYRSMDGPVIVDVMRRVARGELFIQKRSSDLRKDQFDIARNARSLGVAFRSSFP